MSTKQETRVRDVFSEKVHTIDGMATVADALSLIQEHGVSSLVVRPRALDDEAGLLVVSDIAKGVINENRSPERVQVYEVMSKPVMTVSADMLARYAVRMLTRFDVSRTVVVDTNGDPIGIVTLRDLVLGCSTD